MKNTSKYILLIFALFILFRTQAQLKIDSLKNLLDKTDNTEKAYIYNELCEAYLDMSEFDSVICYANKAKQFSEKYNNFKELAISYNYKAYIQYYKNNYDSALVYFNEAYKFSVKAKFEKGQADNLALISRIYFKKGFFDKSLEKLYESIDVDKKSGNMRGVAISYLDLGSLFKHTGNYQMSVNSYFEALRIFEKLNEPSAVASINGNISYVYADWKDYLNAMKYIRISEKIFIETNDQLNLAKTYNSIGLIFNNLHKNDSAYFYFNNALNIFKELKLDFEIALTKGNIAKIYEENNDFDNALKSLISSDELFDRVGNMQEKTTGLFNIGRLYLLKNDFIKSKHYLYKALKFAYSIKNVKLISEIYKLLSLVNAETGNYKNAYENFKRFYEINDSIFNETVHKQVTELQTKYETEKKEKEIEHLKSESQIKDVKLSRSKILWMSLSLISILLIIIAVTLIKRIKLKAEINQILSLKNKQLNILNATKTKFFAIISHDLLNPLSAIHTLANTIETSFDEIEKKQLYEFIVELNKSSEKTYLLLQNLLAWASVNNGRMKYRPENIDLKHLLNEITDVLKINASEKLINIHSEIPNNTISFIDKLMISTVLRNLISNAIKFSNEKSVIRIFSEEINDMIQITVKDSGIGISKNDMEKLFKIEIDTNEIGTNIGKGTGLGLILSKELIEKCSGKIWAKSNLNEGSEFIFTVPGKKEYI